MQPSSEQGAQSKIQFQNSRPTPLLLWQERESLCHGLLKTAASAPRVSPRHLLLSLDAAFFTLILLAYVLTRPGVYL